MDRGPTVRLKRTGVSGCPPVIGGRPHATDGGYFSAPGVTREGADSGGGVAGASAPLHAATTNSTVAARARREDSQEGRKVGRGNVFELKSFRASARPVKSLVRR